MRFVFTMVCCLLLSMGPLPAAAELPMGLPSLPELHESPGNQELWEAVERLVHGVLPCSQHRVEYILECVNERIQEFIPSCQHIVPCPSMVLLTVRPGFRLEYELNWYSKQAWATVPMMPPLRDNDGMMLFLCVNMEGHCGRML